MHSGDKTKEPSNTPSQSPEKPTSNLDTLINLEVLKAAKSISSSNLLPTSSPNPHPASDFSLQFQNLELKISAQLEALKLEFNLALAPLMRTSPSNHSIPSSNLAPTSSKRSASTQTISSSSPTTSGTSIPIPSMFAFPPPPIRSFKTISVQTDIIPPASSSPPQPKTYTKKVPAPKTSPADKTPVSTSPPQPKIYTRKVSSPTAKASPVDKTPVNISFLGAPPRDFRNLGSFAPLSQRFHSFFGPNIPAKHMNKINKPKKTIKETNDPKDTNEKSPKENLVKFKTTTKKTDEEKPSANPKAYKKKKDNNQKSNSLPTAAKVSPLLVDISTEKSSSPPIPETQGSDNAPVDILDLIDFDSPEVTNSFGDPHDETVTPSPLDTHSSPKTPPSKASSTSTATPPSTATSSPQLSDLNC